MGTLLEPRGPSGESLKSSYIYEVVDILKRVEVLWTTDLTPSSLPVPSTIILYCKEKDNSTPKTPTRFLLFLIYETQPS